MKTRSIYLLLTFLAPIVALGQATFPLTTPRPDLKLQPGVPGGDKIKSIGNIHTPNLYDGSYNLTIPFYNYVNDYGTYPVTINYNTKGIPVNMVASSVGLGWHLRASGSITRVLKDVPDEMFIPTFGFPEEDRPVPALGKLTMMLAGNTLSEAGGAYTYPTANYLDNIDGEHDDFILSVPGGLSFTFNIGKDGYIFTHPKQYCKIELLHNDTLLTYIKEHTSSPYLFTFRVTDEQGVVYHFTPGEIYKWGIVKSILTTPPTQVLADYVARWDLTKIEFPNGQEIVYKFSEQSVSSAAVVSKSSVAAEVSGTKGLKEEAVDVSNWYTSTKRLDTIFYPNNEVVLFKYRQFPSGQTRCDFKGGDILDTVMIYSRNKSIKYFLQHWYQKSAPYNANYTDTDIPCESLTGIPSGYAASDYIRLFLSQIRLVDQVWDDGDIRDEVLYDFEYDDLRLPPRWSGSRDFYGYYNGKAVSQYNGRFDIPSHQNLLNTSDNYGVDRSHDPAFAKAGLLKSYKNAYNGKTSFVYEGHGPIANYLSSPSSPALLGAGVNDGLRVKQIIRTDLFNPDAQDITEYTYSGAQRFFPGGYNHIPEKANMSTRAITSYIYMNEFVSPFHLVNGSNHGYTTVTETRKNQLGQVLGKQVTTFTNFSDATSGSLPRYLMVGGQKHYYQYPYADRQYIRDWEMGLPLEIVQYDMNDKIITRRTNTYTFSLDSTSTAGKVENKKILKVNGSGSTSPNDKYDSVAYRPYTGHALLSRSVMQQYVSDAVTVKDTVLYEYDSRQRVVKMTTRNSDGRASSLEYLYNYNVTGTRPAALAAFPSHLSLLLGMERWALPAASGGTGSLLESSLNRYEYNAGKILLKAHYATELGDALTDVSFAGGNYGTATFLANRYNALKQVYSDATPASFKEISRSVLHDAEGNVLTSELLDDQIFNASLWDTVSGRKLAEVTNAENKDIAFAGFDHAMAVGMVYTEFTDYTSGNFTMTMGGVKNGGICGKYYALDLPLWDPVLTSGPLTPGKKYILQLWSMGGPPSVTGGGLSSVFFTEQYSVGDWKNYVAYITPTTTAPIVIKKGTTTAVALDEVRLHPADSKMASYTYAPLSGITAASDATGRLIFTEYDQYGRVKLTRDQEGKIINQKEYRLRY